MNAADFGRIALSIEGVQEGIAHGGSRLPCRRQDLCDSGLAKSGLRQPDDNSRTPSGLRPELPEVFLAIGADGEGWE